MKRLTISLDDRTYMAVKNFAQASQTSTSALMRSMLVEMVPMFERSVDLYRMAQEAGEQGKKSLLQTASRLESTVPAQQELLRSYKTLVAQVGEAMDNDQDD
jgi:hypothetical protein